MKLLKTICGTTVLATGCYATLIMIGIGAWASIGNDNNIEFKLRRWSVTIATASVAVAGLATAIDGINR
jgi:hypothetical protein